MNKFLGYCLFICLLAACKEGGPSYARISGQTMGTTYNITCPTNDAHSLKLAIDSLLEEVNNGMNHYLPDSYISQFNRADSILTLDISKPAVQYFYDNLSASRRIVKQTNGNFDPTVGALVNYWGFGSEGKYSLTAIDSMKIDSLMETVSFNRIIFSKTDKSLTLSKSDSRVKLDFSAIAKGYGVDKVAELLVDRSIHDYLVEIGGETRLSGVNSKGDDWSLAISEPKTSASVRDAARILAVSNKAVATSGNYRNFYKIGDQTVGHTINPFTGFPEQSNLLSVTIIHDECMYADAYATACMVMGLDRALRFVNTYPEISFLMIYSDETGQMKSVDSGDLTFLN